MDLKKQYKSLYLPSAKKVEIVQVPRLQFAMIDGAIEKGSEPGRSPSFAEATQALYGIAYTLKFMLKKRRTHAIDYPVMALEGLWWVEDGVFDITVKDNWFYTLMILQPEVVTQETFEEGLEQVRKKKGDSESLNKARLAYFEEGLCVQTMHIGPYDTEPANIDRMKEYMQENGLKDSVGPIGGKHHEIYMSDPRKAAPDKMKTTDLYTGMAQLQREGFNMPSTDLPFPASLFIYPAGAVFLEVVYRLLPIPLFLGLFSIFVRNEKAREAFFWILAILTSLIEPAGQSAATQVLPPLAMGFVLFQQFGFNLQAGFFRKYGYFASIDCARCLLFALPRPGVLFEVDGERDKLDVKSDWSIPTMIFRLGDCSEYNTGKGL